MEFPNKQTFNSTNHSDCDNYFFIHNTHQRKMAKDWIYPLISLEGLLLFLILLFLLKYKISKQNSFTKAVFASTFLCSVIAVFELSCWLRA